MCSQGGTVLKLFLTQLKEKVKFCLNAFLLQMLSETQLMFQLAICLLQLHKHINYVRDTVYQVPDYTDKRDRSSLYSAGVYRLTTEGFVCKQVK